VNIMPTSTLSLFNARCASHRPAWASPESDVTLDTYLVLKYRHFPTTQAIVYRADLTGPLGDSLCDRLGQMPYDQLIGGFLAASHSIIGFVYPGLVQHIGFETTGLSEPGHPPYSDCYLPDIEKRSSNYFDNSIPER
jgi:hypothetical protein